MFKKKKNEQNIFGIVGLGRFGSALANELFSSADTDVLVMDTDEDSVRAARDHTEYASRAMTKKLLPKPVFRTAMW